MINNPYEALGIPSTASDEEVKRAYRELSRKYHPDSYIDNPLAGLAEEKFKEVQEAYDDIMREREGRGGYYGGGSGWSGSSSSNRSGSYQGGGQDGLALQAAVNYLNNRRYREALQALSGVRERDAGWYYYSAMANAGLGSNMTALEHARRAVNMEPYNREYQNLLNKLEWSGQRYQSGNYGYGAPANRQTCSTGNCCCDLWIADSCCECMGGDLCSCM